MRGSSRMKPNYRFERSRTDKVPRSCGSVRAAQPGRYTAHSTNVDVLTL